MNKSKNCEKAANDKLAEKYFDIWSEYPIQQFTHQIEGDWIAQDVLPGSRILLAGSGGGREIALLKDQAKEIVAVDISSEMLAKGRHKYAESNIFWHQGDIEYLDKHFADFDLAMALGGVFCYLPQPDLAMRCLYSALKPGGRVVVSVMNSNHYSERFIAPKRTTGRIRRAFSVREIEDLVYRCGFTDIQTRGHRFLLDLLPAAWNSCHDNTVTNQFIRELIEIEKRLIGVAPIEDAKMLWVQGFRPISE